MFDLYRESTVQFLLADYVYAIDVVFAEVYNFPDMPVW